MSKRECYFGKSCVGKTTYLKRLGVDAIDCDSVIRESMDDRYGFKRAVLFRMLQRERFVAYVNLFRRGMMTESIKEQFVARASWIAKRVLDGKFWDIFFDKVSDRDIDFAAVGFYMDIIPKHYVDSYDFIELTENDFGIRVSNGKGRHYDKYVLMALDSMFKAPSVDYTTIAVRNQLRSK